MGKNVKCQSTPQAELEKFFKEDSMPANTGGHPKTEVKTFHSYWKPDGTPSHSFPQHTSHRGLTAER
jgi:hypothetical protein